MYSSLLYGFFVETLGMEHEHQPTQNDKMQREHHVQNLPSRANLNHSLNGPKISPDDGLTPRQRNLLTLQQTRGNAAVLRMLKTTETVQRQNEQAQVNSVEVTPPGSLRFSGSLGPLTADVDTDIP